MATDADHDQQTDAVMEAILATGGVLQRHDMAGDAVPAHLGLQLDD